MWILHNRVEVGQNHFQGTTQYKTISFQRRQLALSGLGYGVALIANMDSIVVWPGFHGNHPKLGYFENNRFWVVSFLICKIKTQAT